MVGVVFGVCVLAFFSLPSYFSVGGIAAARVYLRVSMSSVGGIPAARVYFFARVFERVCASLCVYQVVFCVCASFEGVLAIANEKRLLYTMLLKSSLGPKIENPN